MPLVAWENQHVFYQDAFEASTDEGDVLKVVVGIEPGEGAVGILWNTEADSENRSDLARRYWKLWGLLDQVSDDRMASEAEFIRYTAIKYLSELGKILNEDWDAYPWR